MRAMFALIVSAAIAAVAPAQEKPTKPSAEAEERARAERLAALLKQARSDDKKTRHEAISAIGAMGPAAKPAIPALIELLDSDHEQRSYVRSALVKIGKEALPAVTQALTHKSPNVRAGAAKTLEEMRPDAKSAIPKLVAMLDDPVWDVRWDVCIVLGNAGDAEVVDHLIRVMKTDKDIHIRGVAANAAGRVTGRVMEDSPKAKAVVLAVMECLRDGRIVPKDAEAGFFLAGKQAVPEMLTLLEGAKTPPEHRDVALQVLWPMEPKKISGEDLRRLVKLIDSPADEVRQGVLQLLGPKAVGNADASKRVERALKDKAPLVRIQAAECLYRITGRVNPAIGVLVTEMTNADPEVREAACAAVCEFEANGAPAVPGLIVRLKDSDSDVRFQAARALGQIGPGAKEAVEFLKKVADGDADGGVRGVADQALKFIQPRP